MLVSFLLSCQAPQHYQKHGGARLKIEFTNQQEKHNMKLKVIIHPADELKKAPITLSGVVEFDELYRLQGIRAA